MSTDLHPEADDLELLAVYRMMRGCDPGRAAVLGLPTDELERQLAAFGIDASADAFQDAAYPVRSALALVRVWLEGRTADVSFVTWAACELWRRHLAVRPSDEMIDDWIHEGGQILGNDPDAAAEASGVWARAWAALRARLTPEMRTVRDVELSVFAANLGHWFLDVAEAWTQAGRRSAAHAEEGAVFVRELLEQFVGEDVEFRCTFRASLGRLLVLAGHEPEGERVLRELIREHPEHGAGYARLAELMEKTDPQGAVALLTGAMSTVKHEGVWLIEHTLRRLEGVGAPS